MRKILMLKLTRMGDILETRPLLRDIRRVEPHAHLTLVVNETFREVAELLPGIDRILSFPIFDYVVQIREGEEDLVDLFQRLQPFTDALAETEYDLVLNLTNSRLSGLLMGFTRARQMRGLWYDERGSRRVEGALIRYFGANEGMRRFSPFNLSDFMRCLYGALEPQPPEHHVPSGAEEALAADLLGTWRDMSLVGIQLGASEACKRWRVSDFAQTAWRLMAQEDCRIVLLGSPDEQILAEVFLEQITPFDDRVISLVGKTSVSALAAVTARLRLLISNDTGTMHMAAFLGVPVINLSLGSAYFRETGPYGYGNLILEPRIQCRPCDFNFECDHFRCKQTIPVELVTSLALARLQGVTPLGPILQDVESCDVYETLPDRDGLLDYARLTARPLLGDEVLLHVYRVALLQSELGGDFSLRLEDGLHRLLRDGNSLAPGALEHLERVLEALLALEHLAQRGVQTLEAAMELHSSGDLKTFETLLGQSERLDQELIALARTLAEARLFVRTYFLGKESVRAAQVELLLRGEKMCYFQLHLTATWARVGLQEALRLLAEAGSNGKTLERATSSQADREPENE